jgi:hypothetical protein
MFDLPVDADPGPAVTDFRFEKVNAVTDTKDIVGKSHIFRVEPTGGEWWVPSKSYFRTRLKVVVSMNEVRYPAWSSANANNAAKNVKQPAKWPNPPIHPESQLKNQTDSKILGLYDEDQLAVTGTQPDEAKTEINGTFYSSNVGLTGESLSMIRTFTDANPASGTFNAIAIDVDTPSFRGRSMGCNQRGIGYFSAFKPFTALKFVEVADCATDAFFDQMSFSVGPSRVETVRYPQLVNTMNRRTKYSPVVNATRFDSMGIFSDEQQPGTRNSNLKSGKTTVFDLLGYSNINVTANPVWTDQYTVEFDVLYVPPLSVFDLPHALPSARYEIEFKGVASHMQVQRNFFHVTMPGGTGRYYMQRDPTDNSERPGVLNKEGPAKLLDGKHNDGRSATQHPNGGSIFVYEPPICAGPRFNEIAVQAHYLGRQMTTSAWLKTATDRFDPGYFISVQCVSIELEAAMATGPLLTDSTYVLQFDQLSAHFLPLSGSNTTQSLIFDVDPLANHFMFGFRPTNVDDDPCLQEGHLVCPANVERDLKQYYISFDMKTRPTSFATNITLKHPRGAVNEMVRSQINNNTLYSSPPETMRSWLKKGPYYAYDWPRDGTSNATRLQLNLFFHEPSGEITDGKTMGPHGMFENEMPLVFANPLTGLRAPTPGIEDANSTWTSASMVPARSNSYILDDDLLVRPAELAQVDIKNSLFWYAPRLWYSIYYPASTALLIKQTRIDATDRVEPSKVRGCKPDEAGNATFADVNYTVSSALESVMAGAHNLASVAESDRGYKGTEHSRPTGAQLADPNNSCVLFQSIPRKFIITTSSGRVVAVRTLDNRT